MKEMRPAWDNIWYSVDEIKDFYGDDAGYSYWSWVDYRHGNKEVEVVRVSKSGDVVPPPIGMVSSDSWQA